MVEGWTRRVAGSITDASQSSSRPKVAPDLRESVPHFHGKRVISGACLGLG